MGAVRRFWRQVGGRFALLVVLFILLIIIGVVSGAVMVIKK